MRAKLNVSELKLGQPPTISTTSFYTNDEEEQEEQDNDEDEEEEERDEDDIEEDEDLDLDLEPIPKSVLELSTLPEPTFSFDHTSFNSLVLVDTTTLPPLPPLPVVRPILTTPLIPVDSISSSVIKLESTVGVGVLAGLQLQESVNINSKRGGGIKMEEPVLAMETGGRKERRSMNISTLMTTEDRSLVASDDTLQRKSPQPLVNKCHLSPSPLLPLLSIKRPLPTTKIHSLSSSITSSDSKMIQSPLPLTLLPLPLQLLTTLTILLPSLHSTLISISTSISSNLNPLPSSMISPCGTTGPVGMDWDWSEYQKKRRREIIPNFSSTYKPERMRQWPSARIVSVC